MADKLRQLVSQFVEFVDGERPTATKFNALSAQTRRGFEALEYAIGDLQNQSWANSTAMLTIPYGTKWHQPLFLATVDFEPTLSDPEEKKKVLGASDLGRPLDIVNLARLIGPASNLNPQVLTQGSQVIKEVICESDSWGSKAIPPHTSQRAFKRNQYALRYPPAFNADNPYQSFGVVKFYGPGSETIFQTSRIRQSDIRKAGDYHVSSDGIITTYLPMDGQITCEYTTDSLQWGGGSSHMGSTFNVIPDPNQLISAGGEGVGVTGPTLEGSYMITLPVITHQQKNFDGSDTELSNEQDYNTNLQLTLPEWLTGEDSTGQALFQPGDIIPQGSIYLKCIDTNEIYNDAQYIYDTEKTLQVRNVDLGDNGCGLTFCLITVGTDITTAIDDVRRKQFQHSHDRRFGEPFIHITSIVGQLDQGDRGSGNGEDHGTSRGGPYFPSKIPCDYFPQYLHRDGFRYSVGDFNTKSANLFGENEQSMSPASNANALRGSLILGTRSVAGTEGREFNYGFNPDGTQRAGTEPGSHGATYQDASDNTKPSYLGSTGETFHLVFGNTPTHSYQAVGGLSGDANAENSKVRSDGESWNKLPKYGPQIYRNHLNELRIEGQSELPPGGSDLKYIPDTIAKEYRFKVTNWGRGNGVADSTESDKTESKHEGSTMDPFGWHLSAKKKLNARAELTDKNLSRCGLGMYAKGGIVLDNMTYGRDSSSDEEIALNEGIKLYSNHSVNTIANKGDIAMNAKRDIHLYSDQGDISINAIDSGDTALPGTAGRVNIGGLRFGLSLESKAGDIPRYNGESWDANFIASAQDFNIYSGSNSNFQQGGTIFLHAASHINAEGNDGPDTGRLIFATQKYRSTKYNPHFSKYGWDDTIQVDQPNGAESYAGVTGTASISMLPRCNASLNGLALWDPENDTLPRWTNEGYLWGSHPNTGCAEGFFHPQSAMLWVKRNILPHYKEAPGTGQVRRYNHNVCVFEDSTPDDALDVVARDGDTINLVASHTAFLAQRSRSHLADVAYGWLTFRCQEAEDSDFGLGGIRSTPTTEISKDSPYFRRDIGVSLEMSTNDCSDVVQSADDWGAAGTNIDPPFRSGDLQYLSGAADYAEAIILGDPNEWSDVEKFNSENCGIPEGTLLKVREGKAWRSGPGRSMVVTARAAIIGNRTHFVQGKPHVNLSFIGQVPVIVKGKSKDGDLLIPYEDETFAIAVDPEEISFSDYKKAIGTVYGKVDTDNIGDEDFYKVNCAVSIK